MLSLIPLFALVFATEISPLERLGLGIMVKYAGASYCNEQLETWNCTVCQSLPQTMFYQKFYSRINDMSGYIAMTTTPIRPDAPTAKTIIISFRGTKVYSIKNWFVDFNTFQTPLQNPKTDDSIKVHRGFQSAYLRFKNSIRESTVRLLNAYPDANVHVTGMGGSTAVICALDLADFLPTNVAFFTSDRVSVYTFGQTRLGNKEFSAFASRVFGERMFRVVHLYDYAHELDSSDWIHHSNEYWQNENGTVVRCFGYEDPKCSEAGDIPAYNFKRVRDMVNLVRIPQFFVDIKYHGNYLGHEFSC